MRAASRSAEIKASVAGELTTLRAAPPVSRRDNRLLESFCGWLRGRVSDETADYYVGVVERGEWPPSRGKHVKAWRRYIHCLFSIGGLEWGQYQAYLLYLKTPGSGGTAPWRPYQSKPLGNTRIYWAGRAR